MHLQQAHTIPAGTVVEVNDRKHIEALIFGERIEKHDEFAFATRQAWLSTIEEMLSKGGKLIKV
jgi:hypothetical protein